MKVELSRFPYFDHPPPLALAHRGGAKLPGLHELENTMATFRAAADLGYTYLETDVHASRDGVVYAFHDLDLRRLAGLDDAIGGLRSDEVDAVRLGGVEPIPRLTTLLTELPETRLNIDVKTDEAVEATVRTLREHDAVDRVCLASFSGRRLRRLRRLLPDVATSTGPLELAAVRLGPLRWIRAHAVRAGAQCLQVPIRRSGITIVTERFVARAHDLGMQVHVWTVDDPEEVRSLLRIGVDGFVTDRPDVVKDVLVATGHWRNA